MTNPAPPAVRWVSDVAAELARLTGYPDTANYAVLVRQAAHCLHLPDDPAATYSPADAYRITLAVLARGTTIPSPAERTTP